MLENIVWLGLRRRGYEVTVGKVGTTEVDFVAQRREDTMYVQVTTTIAETSSLHLTASPAGRASAGARTARR